MIHNFPIWEKVTLTIEEASAYSNIGEKSIREALKNPSCPFAFSVGRKSLVKRKEFDNYISKHSEL